MLQNAKLAKKGMNKKTFGGGIFLDVCKWHVGFFFLLKFRFLSSLQLRHLSTTMFSSLPDVEVEREGSGPFMVDFKSGATYLRLTFKEGDQVENEKVRIGMFLLVEAFVKFP